MNVTMVSVPSPPGYNHTSGLTTCGTTRSLRIGLWMVLHSRTNRMCVLSENSGSCDDAVSPASVEEIEIQYRQYAASKSPAQCK